MLDRHATTSPWSGGSRGGHAEFHRSDIGKGRTEQPRAEFGEAPGITRRELSMGRIGGGRGFKTVDAQQLGQGGGSGRRRIDNRDSVAGERCDDRPQERIVRASEQQRVDRGTRWSREDRFTVRVPLAKQRRQRCRDRRLGLWTALDPSLDHRDERRGRMLVDLDRGVLVLDRPEVGM